MYFYTKGPNILGWRQPALLPLTSANKDETTTWQAFAKSYPTSVSVQNGTKKQIEVFEKLKLPLFIVSLFLHLTYKFSLETQFLLIK